MNGITFIETVVVNAGVQEILGVVFIGLLCLFMLYALVTFLTDRYLSFKKKPIGEREDISEKIFDIVRMTVLELLCVLVIWSILKPYPYKKYRVTIDESASYLEFNEKYEMLEKCDDGTYFIREK